jgi:hypothetical protein
MHYHEISTVNNMEIDGVWLIEIYHRNVFFSEYDGNTWKYPRKMDILIAKMMMGGPRRVAKQPSGQVLPYFIRLYHVVKRLSNLSCLGRLH